MREHPCYFCIGSLGPETTNFTFSVSIPDIVVLERSDLYKKIVSEFKTVFYIILNIFFYFTAGFYNKEEILLFRKINGAKKEEEDAPFSSLLHSSGVCIYLNDYEEDGSHNDDDDSDLMTYDMTGMNMIRIAIIMMMIIVI